MIDQGELQALEDHVSIALAAGDGGRLRLLGRGEVSLVVGWPQDDPRVACKRLPPFADEAAFERYAAVVRRYVDELRDRGVRVVPTVLRHVVRPDGRIIGYHVQPAVPPETFGPALLRSRDPAGGHPLLEAVAQAVVGATHPRLGVDAQLSNWVWVDGEPWQVDLTTPFLLDSHGRPAFDLAPFLAALPAPARPLVRREIGALIRRWATARGALLDMTASLLAEGLVDWVDPALAEINARVTPPIGRDEVARVCAGDRRLWPLLFRLERANRWWRQGRPRRTPRPLGLPAGLTIARRQR